MSSPKLDNLVKVGELKKEPPAQSEIDGLVKGARKRLADAKLESLSLESRFDLSYAAAHSLALAALRWHGYRSESRFSVFQLLVHTSGLSSHQVRVLSDAHTRRNRIAYEGSDEITNSLVDSMIQTTSELLESIEKLGPIKELS